MKHKIISIIILNLSWFMIYILAWASTACIYPTKAIAYFVLEPFFMLGLMPVVVASLSFLIIKKNCNEVLWKKRFLVVIGIVCVMAVYLLLLYDYGDEIKEYGIRIMYYQRYWLR